MSVLLSDQAAGGEFTISRLSLAFGGSVVIAGLLAPGVGRWADRHSVRGLIAFGSALACAALLIFSISTNDWVVVAAFWLLLGPAQAMTLYEPAFVAINLWVTVSQRNKAIALLSVIGGLAGPVFLPITGFAVEQFGWRLATAGLALTVLATGLTATRLFFPGTKPIRESPFRPPSVPWRRFVVDRRLGLFTVAVVLMFASMNTMVFHRVAVFEEQGFDFRYVALLAGVSGLLTFPGRYLAPRWSSVVPATRLLTWSLAGLGLAVILGVVGSPEIVMIAHFGFFGIFFGFTIPLRAVVMNEWYAGEDFGSLMGKQWSAAAVAGGVTPWLIGAGRDALGSYTVPLVALAVAIGLSALFTELSVSRLGTPTRLPDQI